MIRKIIPFVSSLFMAANLVLSGCAPLTQLSPDQEPEPLVLIDGLGRSVSLDAPAQRVVSLAPSNTEILFAVGAGSQVIGRDEFSDHPAEVLSLPSVGGGFSNYNNEAIVTLEPDLVLAAEINTAEQVQALEELGLVVFMLPNPTTLDEMYVRLLTVAQLTGHTAEAESLIDSLKDRVATIEQALAGASERPRVFYELDGTEPNAPWTAGVGTFIDTLITMAVGQNVGAALDGQYGQMSIEALLVADPQVILLGDAAYGVTVESVEQRAGWETLQAVQNGRIYPFDDNLVSRPGPRLVDALEALARLLHPQLFQ